MQRRGLAFEQCRLIEHSVHEAWLNLPLQHMTNDSPVGYAGVSTEQALRADKEIFTLMAQIEWQPQG